MYIQKSSIWIPNMENKTIKIATNPTNTRILSPNVIGEVNASFCRAIMHVNMPIHATPSATASHPAAPYW